MCWSNVLSSWNLSCIVCKMEFASTCRVVVYNKTNLFPCFPSTSSNIGSEHQPQYQGQLWLSPSILCYILFIFSHSLPLYIMYLLEWTLFSSPNTSSSLSTVLSNRTFCNDEEVLHLTLTIIATKSHVDSWHLIVASRTEELQS